MNVKAIGGDPGWQIKLNYVDDIGNVFSRGKFNIEKTVERRALDMSFDFEAEYKTNYDKIVALKKAKEFNPDNTIGDKPPLALTETDKVELEVSETEKKYKEEVDLLRKQLKENQEVLKNIQSKLEIGVSPVSDKAISMMVKAMSDSKLNKDVGVGSEIDFDPDDIDERGVVFTSYGVGFLIIDKRTKLGTIERTPYNRKFQFVYQGSKTVQIGRDKQRSSFCTFRTQSKKEIKWLRDHPHYGILFYENTNLAMCADARLMEIAARKISEINSLDQSRLLQRAKAAGIPIGGNIAEIKTNLALKLAKELMISEERSQKQRTIENYEKTTFENKVGSTD